MSRDRAFVAMGQQLCRKTQQARRQLGGIASIGNLLGLQVRAFDQANASGEAHDFWEVAVAAIKPGGNGDAHVGSPCPV